MKSLVSNHEILKKCTEGSVTPFKNNLGVYNILYKTTCLVNGKVYVGIHSTTDLNDQYIGCGIYYDCRATIDANYGNKERECLGKYLIKYGVSSFVRENLLFFDNIEQALFQERKVVDRGWLLDKRTLNVKFGGTRPPVRVGKDNGNYGNKWTEEQKRHLSELKKQRGDCVGSKNPNAKPVTVIDICTLDFFYFNSSYDACNSLAPDKKNGSLLKALSKKKIFAKRFLVFRRGDCPDNIEILKMIILNIISKSSYFKYFIKNKTWD